MTKAEADSCHQKRSWTSCSHRLNNIILIIKSMVLAYPSLMINSQRLVCHYRVSERDDPVSFELRLHV